MSSSTISNCSTRCPAALRPGRPLRRRLDRRRDRGAPSGAGGAAGADRRQRPVRAGRADRRRIHARAARSAAPISSLRNLLFADPDGELAKRWFPDGRGDIDEEMRRYQMLRFGSFVGFKPPYFYHRELRERLYRASMPALVIWGEHDRMVPPAHGAAYCDGLPQARDCARRRRRPCGASGAAGARRRPDRAFPAGIRTNTPARISKTTERVERRKGERRWRRQQS